MPYDRLYIEITNVCNLNCPFCLPSRQAQRFMSVEDFKHLLSEIGDETDHLYFHVKGEPTLHPQLKTFLDLANESKKKVHLVSNGTRLNALDFDLTSHPALAQLSISLHGILTLPAEQRQQALEHVKDLIMRSENKPFSLFLRVWNERNSELLSWLQETLNQEISYAPHKHRIRLRPNLYLDFDREFTWPSLDHRLNSEQGHCYGGLKMMTILADGTLTPCCLDQDGVMGLGNLFETSFKDLVNSTRYQTFVSEMARNHFSESLCQHCTYHLKHKKGLG